MKWRREAAIQRRYSRSQAGPWCVKVLRAGPLLLQGILLSLTPEKRDRSSGNMSVFLSEERIRFRQATGGPQQ